MDPTLYSLALATLAFVGGHLVLSSGPVRGPLVGQLGENLFRLVYSALVLAAFVWMIAAYNSASRRVLWEADLWGRPVALVLMFFASILFVCSVTTRNPTLAGMDALHRDAEPGRGIYAVTRHPMLSAFALWGVAHLVVNGDTASIFLFGGITVLAVVGMVHIDARRDAAADEAWRAFRAGTSRTPFRAILEGRRSLRPGEIGWWRILAGIVLFAALIAVHGRLFGVAAAGV